MNFKIAHTLKEKLKNQEFTLGTWITLGHPAIAEILASIDFDWIVIDIEHSVIELSQVQQMIQIIESAGKCPLVRLPDQNATTIKKVMDAGAHGVVVPNVKSTKEVDEIINAVKYPPMGTRGVGLARAQGYGMAFDEYEKNVNDGTIVIVQIEHYEGVDNLKDILLYNDVDGIIIGPYDLSGSLGIPGQLWDGEVEECVEKALDTAIKMDKSAGYHVVNPDVNEVEMRVRQGFNFIGYSLDTIMLGIGFSDDIKELRRKL